MDAPQQLHSKGLVLRHAAENMQMNSRSIEVGSVTVPVFCRTHHLASASRRSRASRRQHVLLEMQRCSKMPCPFGPAGASNIFSEEAVLGKAARADARLADLVALRQRSCVL